jgi:hypothetical protein
MFTTIVPPLFPGDSLFFTPTNNYTYWIQYGTSYTAETPRESTTWISRSCTTARDKHTAASSII